MASQNVYLVSLRKNFKIMSLKQIFANQIGMYNSDFALTRCDGRYADPFQERKSIHCIPVTGTYNAYVKAQNLHPDFVTSTPTSESHSNIRLIWYP